MVKVVMSTLAMAVVAADDVTSLLQLSARVRQSQGKRILAAVATGEDTICVQAAAGDVAPVSGSFTARMSQEAVVVAAGSVAGEAGSFCVAKQDVLLIQRTFGLNTARDFEVALGSKQKKATTTTTTKFDWTTHVWDGNSTEEMWVKADGCPSVEAGLVQTFDASVSDKQKKKTKAAKISEDALRVCGCRNFLKESVNMPDFFEKVDEALEKALQEEKGGEGNLLLQRNFDAALATKKAKKRATTTTTTTTTVALEDTNLAKACTAGYETLRNWAEVARQLNNPAHAGLYKLLNITDGSRHCDKSWVVNGACAAYMTESPTTESPLEGCETFFGRGAASHDQIISIVDPDVPALFCDMFKQTAPCTFIHRAQAIGDSNCVSPTPPDACHKYIKVAYSKCDGLKEIQAGAVDVDGKFDPQTGVFKGCEENVISTDNTYWAPNEPISDQPPPTFPDTYKAIKCSEESRVVY